MCVGYVCGMCVVCVWYVCVCVCSVCVVHVCVCVSVWCVCYIIFKLQGEHCIQFSQVMWEAYSIIKCFSIVCGQIQAADSAIYCTAKFHKSTYHTALRA